MAKEENQAIFFKNLNELRQWLVEHHETAAELWLGYYKKSTKKFNYTWGDSVDQFICFGWIDGIRKSIDSERYMIRITPRNPKSNWSAINLEKVEKLIRANKMFPKGLLSYENRRIDRERQYSFEQESIKFPEGLEQLFKRDKVAWNFFKSCSQTVQKQSTWYVISAKREATQKRRLDQLISCSAKQEKLPQFTWKK